MALFILAAGRQLDELHSEAARIADELNLKLRTNQFAPPPDKAASLYGREVVPSHLEFNGQYRPAMGTKSYSAMRNVDYPDPAHALTAIEEQQTSAAGDTPPDH